MVTVTGKASQPANELFNWKIPVCHTGSPAWVTILGPAGENDGPVGSIVIVPPAPAMNEPKLRPVTVAVRVLLHVPLVAFFGFGAA